MTVQGGTAYDGWGGLWGIQGVDTLISIENIVGSTFGDLIIASTDGTRMSGRGGNDTLVGGSGKDTIDYSDAKGGVDIAVGDIDSDGNATAAQTAPRRCAA